MSATFGQAWVIVMAGERAPFAAFLSEARAREQMVLHRSPAEWEVKQVPLSSLPPGLRVQV